MFLISWINHHLYLLLGKTHLTSSLVSHEISAGITLLLVYLLVMLLCYELVLYILVRYNWMEAPGKEFFIDKPVHCAHVYINLNLSLNHIHYGPKLQSVFKKPIVYHLEFGPMDYDIRNPEMGTTLGFTKEKILHLFHNSKYYHEHKELSNKTTRDLQIYHHKKQLTNDDEFLCLLGVDTGNKIDCFIDLD